MLQPGRFRFAAAQRPLLRAASSPGAIKGVLEALRDAEVRDLLPRLAVPTLVMHRRADRAVRVEAGRHLAGAIPRARMVELDGADHWIWPGSQDPVLAESASSRASERGTDALAAAGSIRCEIIQLTMCAQKNIGRYLSGSA